MKGIKPNYAKLGRQYNCDPRTVKKYYEAGKENELEGLKKRKQTKKTSKLDPFKEIFDEKVELGCTAQYSNTLRRKNMKVAIQFCENTVKIKN